MRMSSIYTITKVLVKVRRISSIILIKVVGARLQINLQIKFYWDLVVAKLQINITKVFGPCELIKEVADSGNRVPFFYCDFI